MMSRLRPFRALAALALFVPALAFAHPGHGEGWGFVAGLLHPATGADHAIAMLAIGLWSVRLGRAAARALPAVFLALCAGAFLGASGTAALAMQPLLAASVLALGLLVATPARAAWRAGAALAAAFAAIHGLAHGAQMPAGSLAYALGIVCASVLLALAGAAAGALLGARGPLARAVGVPIALTGLGLTATAALALL